MRLTVLDVTKAALVCCKERLDSCLDREPPGGACQQASSAQAWGGAGSLTILSDQHCCSATRCISAMRCASALRAWVSALRCSQNVSTDASNLACRSLISSELSLICVECLACK